MKLKYQFEFVDVGDEIIAVPVGEGAKKIHGILKLNNAGKEIMELLTSETSEEQVVRALAEIYEDEKEKLLSFVQATANALNKAGLIE